MAVSELIVAALGSAAKQKHKQTLSSNERQHFFEFQKLKANEQDEMKQVHQMACIFE